jgi:hypothetical protein
MADVVLSYAREDRPQAESLSRALADAGWSVWWDREILPGASYEQIIEAELSTARCVVVLWSASARQSNWVRDEATLALGRNVLVSVLLDDSSPPLGFRQQQTVSLAHWNGSTTDPEFALLTQGIARVIGEGAPRGVRLPQVDTRVPARPKRLKAAAIAAVILGCVLAGGATVMWSNGYFRQRGTAPPARNAPDPRASGRVERTRALVVPADATLTLPRENVALTVLSGTLERLNADTRLLSLHIRVANHGTRSFYRTYYSDLRLVVDGVPRAPNDTLYEQVETSSAREFDYRFDVPAAATRAVLRIINDNQTDEIQLDFPAAGR